MQAIVHTLLRRACTGIPAALAVTFLCSAFAAAQQPTSSGPREDPLHRLAVRLASDDDQTDLRRDVRDGAVHQRSAGQATSEGSHHQTAAPLTPITDIAEPRTGEASSDAASIAAEPGAFASAMVRPADVVEGADEPRTPLRQRGGATSSSSIEAADDSASAASTSPITRSGAGWILQTITALGVVIGLILLLRWGYTKLTGQVAATANSPVVEVLSRTTIAPRNQVLLVRLGQRILVVGDSPAGLRTLADVDDPEEVAALLTAVTAARPGSMTSGFSQMLNRFNNDYEGSATEAVEDVTEPGVQRARGSLSGLLARIRTVGAQT